MWFETLTGFAETSPEQVREHLAVEGDTLVSRVNGRRYVWGALETPSLADLRARLRARPRAEAPTTVREVVADVRALHADPRNAHALFQVASQFNLLEMVSPHVTPEQGVGRYEHDPTQGPACAIACGAGTIYRNYFAPVDGQTGQTATRQIDCLADLGAALGNTDGRLWEMRNGYALPTEEGLDEIAGRLRAATERERDALRARLRIGVQWGTQVTLGGSRHVVSQAYCSALPVAYGRFPAAAWQDLATLVLEAAYEATFCAAVDLFQRTGHRRLFLTLLGGGAFGNETAWIVQALARALDLHRHDGLDVAIVSYGAPHPALRALTASASGKAEAPGR